MPATGSQTWITTALASCWQMLVMMYGWETAEETLGPGNTYTSQWSRKNSGFSGILVLLSSHIVNCRICFCGYMCCHTCKDSKGEFWGWYGVLKLRWLVENWKLNYQSSVSSKRSFFFMSTHMICAGKLCAAVPHWFLTQLTFCLCFVALMKWLSMTFQPQWTLFWRKLARNKYFTLAIHRAPPWVCGEMHL